MARNSKQFIAEFVKTQGWAAIGDAEWASLRGEFPEVPERSIRVVLQESGLRIEQPWRGLVAKSLGELEEGLIAMSAAYAGKPALARTCRNVVIQAKDRAKFAMRNPKVDAEKRALKAEMVEWMLVWLGDPAMFEPWVRIRKAVAPEPSAPL